MSEKIRDEGTPHPALRATFPQGKADLSTAAGGGERRLEVIGAEIRALTSSMLQNIIEIGRRMVEAKELLPHGEFGPWIKENTGYSHSTANNFMRLFNEYGNPQQSLFGAEVNSQTFGKLSYTKALALLALPTEAEREEFVETHDVDAMSTRELEQAIRERDEARKRAEEAETREKEAREELAETADMLDKTLEERNARGVLVREHEEQIADLERELEELRSRPVDVAVQEPDPAGIEKRAAELAKDAQVKAEQDAAAAIAKAKQEAKDKLKKAEERAKAERAELENKLKAAEEKLTAAGAEDRSEAEKLRATVESLKKELAMSGQEITAFRLRFAAWQEAYRNMREAMQAVPEESREKLRDAVKAQVQAWQEAQ